MKSSIFIYCETRNQRLDAILCFATKCKKIKKCKSLEAVKNEIEKWYEKEKEKPREDTEK